LNQREGTGALPAVIGPAMNGRSSKKTVKKMVLAVATLSLVAVVISGCGGAGGGGAGNGGTTSTPSGAGTSGGPGRGGAAGVVSGAAGTGGASPGGASGQAGGGGSAAAGGGAGSSAGSGGGGGSGGSAGMAGVAGRGGDGGRAGTGGQAGAGAGGVAGTAGSGGGRGGAGGGGAGAGGASGRGGQGGTSGGGGQSGAAQRVIAFGTLLDPQAVMAGARQLASALANPSGAQWRAKGDQHRSYRFAEANTDAPYRLYVPTNWDGQAKLPLVMFLHGSGSDENAYVDANNKQMVNLAQQRGYILVAPLGDKGAYGNFLRLSAPFGKPEEAAKLIAQITPESERTNELSEKDVINVLELILAEYPIDRAAMFLAGHSMGSGGTWYIGGKYASYWKGLAPLSGPFVQETGYPWDSVRPIYLFVTEGTQTPSLEGSRALADWLTRNQFMAEYVEVNADHGGMVRLVLPDIFAFFDRTRSR
jgi:predicted esterase